MDLYHHLVRPLLFALEPETAHEYAKSLLKRKRLWRMAAWAFHFDDEILRTDMPGIQLANPIGLAAGFDKDCEMIMTMKSLGFGFVCAGSILVRPRSGNPKPRMLRHANEQSIIHCLGLPSKGLGYAVNNLKRMRDCGIPIIASVADLTIEDNVECVRELDPFASAFERTLCPNVRYEGKNLENLDLFTNLMTAIRKATNKPIFVKLSPYYDEKEREYALELVRISMRIGIDGLTVAPFKKVREPKLSVGEGTMSGKPVFGDMLRITRDYYLETGGKMLVKACGGIATGDDAYVAIRNGAHAVELLTSLVYEGWSVCGKIKRRLTELLRKDGYSSVNEAVGAAL